MMQSVLILAKWFDPQPKNSGIVYFDGVCSVCNGFVDFLIKRDTAKSLQYAAIQGDTATQKLESSLLENMDSIIFQSGEKTYNKSNAALMAIASLGGWWKFAIWLRIIPRFIRDAVYRIIAHNRYRWFGKRDECRIPTFEERGRILE